MGTTARWMVAVVCLWPIRALGQTNLGRIVGTVRDSSGAVVAGVTVKVKNEGMGWTREFVSLATGDYEVPNLISGTYAVSAELAGFKKFVRSGIPLEAGRTVRIDVRLEPGDLLQEVRVTAQAPVVESETPSISHVIDFEMHTKSAQAGSDRPWEALMLVPSFTSGASKFVYTIAGSRGSQNEYHIDGIASPGEGSTSITMEGTQELKVQAVNNSAEFSKPGIYQQVSRSGTNELHGNIRYSHSNSVLNARSFFAASKGSGRSHSWGAWLAGPLRIPKLYNGTDRTFFALDYEGSRNPNFSNANATVPTAAMRAGDFSGFPTIRDPLTGQPFPGNRIPAERISSVSRAIQERFYPLPNFGNVAVFAALNHRILFDNSDKGNNADLRIDQKLHEKNTIFGRFGWVQFPVKGLESNLPTIGTRSQLRNLRTGVVSDTHIFSPTLVNEIRWGFQRSRNPVRGPQRGLEVLRAVGIQGITNAPDAYSMPTFSITGVQTLSQVNEGLTVSQQYQLSDSLTWIRKGHTMKAGIEIRRPLPLSRSVPAATYGSYTFTGAFSGQGYADFLLGLPQTTSRTSPSPDSIRKRWEYGFFFQDDYKVNRRLTLQLGLRYEYQTPVTNRDLLYTFDPATGALIVPTERSLSYVSPLFNKSIPIAVADGKRYAKQGLLKVDTNNFGPRVGFAFRPTASSDFAVRSGYGIFYEGFSRGFVPFGGPFTPGSETFTNRIVNGVPLFQFPRPFPDTPAGPSTSPPNVGGIVPDSPSPYVQQWNFTVEKAFLDVGWRASYIGTKSTQLVTGRNINLPRPSTTPFSQARRPWPLYRDISLSDPGGNSIYHALQVEAKRRIRNLAFNIGYVYSNTISDTADAGDDMTNPYDRSLDRGREPYAIKHRAVGNLIWPIPIGRGKRFLAGLPAALNHVVGGWETVWTFFIQTGDWFNPTYSGFDPSNTNTLSGRPDRLGDGRVPRPTIQRWFDPTAFAIPPANAGRFGTAGKNFLQGPPLRVLHLGLLKEFPIRERAKLMIEAAARNVLNHPNFGLPNRNITSPLVAQITGLDGGLERPGARNIQLRGRLSW